MPRDNDLCLTAETARRVARAVRIVEAMPSGEVPGRSAPIITAPSRYAVVTVAIGAGSRSAKTLGSGKGTLQLIGATKAGGTTTYKYAPIPGQPDVVILNGGDAVAAGRLIQVKVIDGYFNVDVDYC